MGKKDKNYVFVKCKSEWKEFDDVEVNKKEFHASKQPIVE